MQDGGKDTGGDWNGTGSEHFTDGEVIGGREKNQDLRESRRTGR